MSYSAYISFKAIEADKVYPFVQSMKTMALDCLGEIAKAEWPYCPLVRNSWIEWQDAGYEAPLGEAETLFLLDNAQILHIQATDEGFDYSIYDADSMKLIDGGQFSMEGAKMHPAKTLMDGAFKEVCVLQGIEPAKVETLPLEKLGEISQTDALPMEPELQQDTPEKSALPDPTITPHMMERYGYTDQDMLPLSKDRALELAARDVTIYLLYRDGNEKMAFDAEEIMQHDGIFGVSRDEWEAIREDVPPRDIEQRFQNNPNDAFVIYQLNESESRDRLFVEYDRLDSPPQREHYAPIYTGDLQYAESTAETLEGLFQSFNIHRPGDFSGHSLSVSDIIAIKQDGEVSYHYCDSVGFRELSGFNQPENYLKSAETAMEDDLGMIDGIINNCPRQPTVAELEAQVNAGQTISLMDLAAAVQAERKAAPKAKEERPSIIDNPRAMELIEHCAVEESALLLESTDEYTAYCREHPKEFSESEAWFLRVFSFRWFYDTKWKMLGVYAVPSAMRSLFDGTVCFQNSTDQDYFRGEWDGIPVFEQIYDQWVVGKGDEFIKRKLIKNKSYKAEEITSKLLDYARRTFAYEEIWSRIEPTLYDDDHAVFLSLFSSIYDIRARDKFLRMCFQNAVVPKLDKEV